MAIWAKLVSKGDPQRFLSFDNSTKSLTIGRSPDSSLVLNDMHISGKHLTLVQGYSQAGERCISAVDSSSNGTWLDGERLASDYPVTLRHGNVILLPSDEGLQHLFSFVFIEFAKEIKGGAEGITIVTADTMTKDEMEQWRKIDKLHARLTAETSRLAAKVYSAQDNGQFNLIDEQNLKESNEHMRVAIEDLLSKMKETSLLISSHTSLTKEEKEILLDRLDVKEINFL